MTYEEMALLWEELLEYDPVLEAAMAAHAEELALLNESYWTEAAD